MEKIRYGQDEVKGREAEQQHNVEKATGKVKYKRFAIKILIWFEEHFRGKGFDMSTRDARFLFFLYVQVHLDGNLSTFSYTFKVFYFELSLPTGYHEIQSIPVKSPPCDSV